MIVCMHRKDGIAKCQLVNYLLSIGVNVNARNEVDRLLSIACT
jgi:hypothetical protein